MKRAACIALAALLLAACGGGSDDDEDDKVSWRISFVSGTCTCTGCSCGSCACGGATVQASGSFLTVESPPWILGEAIPWAEAAPPVDPEALALADSLAPRHVAVIDAAAVPGGVAALLRGRSGETGIALLGSAPEPAVIVPDDALRVVPSGEDPATVRIHLGAATVVPATRARD